MRTLSIYAFLFCSICAYSQSMKVHTKGSSTPSSYDLASIDSITFELVAIPTNGLLAYYPFFDSAKDASGKGNNGTVVNAMPCNDRFNIPNSAYHFDGSGDSIFANIANIPTGNQPRTISAFIWIDSIPATDGYIVGWGSGGTDKEFYLNHYNGYYRVITLNNDIPEFKQITTKKWVHFVATYDSDTMRAYIDTVQCAKKRFGSLVTISSHLIFGMPAASPSSPGYKGSIDDVAVYNRALTKAEIVQIYKSGGWTGN